MHYLIYKITNLIDNKEYIGSHKTKNINDDYMGSGKYLKRAVEKYGLVNFKKEILFDFDTAQAMYQKESELVTEEYLTITNTYNLKVGGFGSWDYVNESCGSQGKRLNDSLTSEQRSKGGRNSHKTMKERKINIYSDNWINPLSTEYSKEKSRSPEVRSRAVKSAKETYAKIGHQQGYKNSQFGTMWITNGLETVKVKKDTILPRGFKKGRK